MNKSYTYFFGCSTIMLCILFFSNIIPFIGGLIVVIVIGLLIYLGFIDIYESLNKNPFKCKHCKKNANDNEFCLHCGYYNYTKLENLDIKTINEILDITKNEVSSFENFINNKNSNNMKNYITKSIVAKDCDNKIDQIKLYDY
jgi:hypothetical protein